MKRVFAATVILICLLASTASAQKKPRVEPADVYVRTARIALPIKDFKRAEKALATCLKHYPENADAHFLMGVIWAEKDQIDSMVTEFGLARKYATGKKLKDIEKKMTPIEEDKWEHGFNSGVIYINLADSLDDVAGETQDPEEGQKLRGMVGQALDESGRNFRNCTLIQPDEFRGWFNLGLVYDRKRDYAKAAEIYKISEEKFHTITLGDTTTNFYDSTMFYQGQGEPTPLFKDMIKKFKKMKEDLRNRYKGLLTALGGVYFELGEYENTIIVFRRLLGFYKEDLSALEYIGGSYQQLGFSDEALEWTQAIIKRNPDDKDRLYNVGVHYYNDGVDGKKKYENLLKEKLEGSKDPNIDDEVNKAKDRYGRSFDRAEELFTRVLELDPKDKETWKLKGLTIFFLDRHEEAIPIIEKAREMLPDDRTLCEILRECFRRQGDIETVLRLTEECGL